MVCRSASPYSRGPAATTCCSHSRARSPRLDAATSMRLENGLIGRNLTTDRRQFDLCGVARIGRWWQAAEFHQTGHQQQPRLGGRQIAPADEAVARRCEALVIAAAD